MSIVPLLRNPRLMSNRYQGSRIIRRKGNFSETNDPTSSIHQYTRKNGEGKCSTSD
jgi:hypothetical protein